MFWGLIMDSGKRYSQTVERAFHISMACLEPNTADSDNVSVMLVFDNREFILCNLNKQKAIQSPLDLNFQSGDKIAFMSSGKGRVHLTGYLLETDEDEDDDDLDDEIGNDNSMDVSDIFEKSNTLMKGSGKRKNEPQQAKSENKKLKLEAEAEEKSSDEDDDDDDDDDEDDDDDVVSGGDSDELGSDEEDDEDDDDDEDEDDEDDDDDSAEDMELGSPKSKTPEKKKKSDKQGNKTPNEVQTKNKTPGEKQKNKSLIEKQQKDKTPKSQQQKNKTGPNTPATQINGVSEQQSGKKNKKGGETPKGAKSPGGVSPQKKTLEGGVVVEDIRVGNGPVAKPGRLVTVYYVGRLKSNNKQFDQTTEGSGFKFRLGKGEVIRGWDIGVNGMRIGGKRKIICPPALAYGSKGSPPAIPPNSALVFEVELNGVN